MDILDLRSRFFANIRRGENGCIEWTGARLPAGYGVISVDSRNRPATHVSWFIKYGTWPGWHMLHRCDNPPCVNPEHLFEGDDAANAADRVAKGRSWQILTGLEVSEIVALTETRMGLKEIADLFGVTAGHVSNLRHGRFRTVPATRQRKPTTLRCKSVVDGEELTLEEIAQRYGQPLSRVRQRYSRGARGADLIRARYAHR